MRSMISSIGLNEALLNMDADVLRQFAAMLVEEEARKVTRAEGHRCWTWVPSRAEYEIMAKYAVDDKCPKCGKGRVVLEIFKGGGFGDSYWLKCYWGAEGCGFKESATCDEDGTRI